MSRQVKGSCLCGSVRYEGEADPAFAFCHCRDCQKATGAGYTANVAVPTERLALDGPLRTYRTQGGSGTPIARSFCGECGSPIAIQCGGALEGLSLVQAGTLEDASWVEPSAHIFCASAQPWDVVADNAPAFPQAPPPPQ
ncbi:MAG: GFA family protein [Pseudomonadota bacterium]|nr:GFA family protein [Pseudomonadota bacterium]